LHSDRTNSYFYSATPILKQWWKAKGQDWHFSYQQRQVLKQYYDANKLLVDCLNSASNVAPAVRSHIEETLLLPTEMLPNAEG
jgi:hypothetical protein